MIYIRDIYNIIYIYIIYLINNNIYIYTSYPHIYILRARATLGYREKKMSPGRGKVCKSCTTQYTYTHTV